MATRTITAMFHSRAEAERAGEALVSQMGVGRAMIRTTPQEGMSDEGYDKNRPYEDKGYFGSLKDLLVPDEDRYAYAEGMRRGSVLLSTQVDEGQIEKASDILEHAGAVDLDAEEANWRRSGWTGYDAAAHSRAGGGATASSAPRPASAASVTGDEGTIQVVEEQLRVGKRAVEGGRVKVRAYVVEREVEEQVTLRDETVRVERQSVDREATEADLAAFKDKTIEMREMDEEAVVAKDVRVVEEIDVRKEASDRVETVRDTVRRTQVDVEDSQATSGAGRSSVAGGASGAAGSMDKTLNTNVSGQNPGADAPDGAPGNPPGTMASRAVDKTLGTNVSGANPERK